MLIPAFVARQKVEKIVHAEVVHAVHYLPAQARALGQFQQRLGHLACRLFLTTIKYVYIVFFNKKVKVSD